MKIDQDGYLILDERSADLLAERTARHFHSVGQKLKGGTLTGPNGQPGPNPAAANQWGGKGIVKYNPTEADINVGTRQQQSLLVWQSPDGLPHYVTVEVGRLASSAGGPGADNTPSGTSFVLNPAVAFAQGSVGGGTWPAGQDVAGNPLYYRATAQIVLGTPGVMEDSFWIDINRGQRFTAVASYVAVTAQMNPPPTDESTGSTLVPPPYTTPYLSGSLVTYATLGVDVAPSLSPVLYTQYIDTTRAIQNNDYFFRVIPPRANFLLPILQSSQVAGAKVAFQFLDNAGIVCGSSPIFTVGTGLNITPFAIPEDAFSIAISNTFGAGPGANSSIRLIYQLSV